MALPPASAQSQYISMQYIVLYLYRRVFGLGMFIWLPLTCSCNSFKVNTKFKIVGYSKGLQPHRISHTLFRVDTCNTWSAVTGGYAYDVVYNAYFFMPIILSVISWQIRLILLGLRFFFVMRSQPNANGRCLQHKTPAEASVFKRIYKSRKSQLFQKLFKYFSKLSTPHFRLHFLRSESVKVNSLPTASSQPAPLSPSPFTSYLHSSSYGPYNPQCSRSHILQYLQVRNEHFASI